MPKGRFGVPRKFSKGPLVKLTDKEVSNTYLTSSDNKVIAEAAIRRTIIDLDRITGLGLIPVDVEGISRIEFGRSVGAYTQDELIEITFEPVVLAAAKDNKHIDFLKAVIAHEYGHHILNHRNMEKGVLSLYNEGIFDFRNIKSMPEFYDFDNSEYKDYSSVQEFIDHAKQYKLGDAAWPHEGFCNLLATRYTKLSPQQYTSMMNSIKARASIIGEKSMKGEYNVSLPEIWQIRWELVK